MSRYRYENDLRIARQLAKRLRACKINVIWWDKRSDRGGLRLHPANLRVGHVWLLCRSTGYAALDADTAFLRDNPSARLWRPCDDFDTLIRYLRLSTARPMLNT